MPIIILLLVVFFAVHFPAPAQVDRASLVGTVFDSSRALIPEARVEAVSQDTGLRREALTAMTGAYTFSLMPIGAYTVSVTRAGFRTVTMKDVRLGVGDNRTLNIQMEVSGVDTAVTVESAAAALEST